MVSKEDTVYILQSGNVVRRESGFKSEGDIEEYINENLPPNNYEYGIFKSVGNKTVEKDPPNKKEYTEIEEKRIEQIRAEARQNENVKSLRFYDTEEQVHRCSIYQQNIQYKNGEVDFTIYIDESLFDDPPVSTLDKSVEKQLIQIFDNVSCGVATYLGYESSYAKRGRRDPYIVMYGRVHREDEELIRFIEERKSVKSVIRSSENISPVPIYRVGDGDDYLPQDYILVMNVEPIKDSFDEIPDSNMKKINGILKNIKSDHPEVQTDWIGRVPFRKNYETIGIGVSIN